MNNKEAIKRILDHMSCLPHTTTYYRELQDAVSLAVLALKRMDKVKFMTEEETSHYLVGDPGIEVNKGMLKLYTGILRDHGILIEEKKEVRCKWTNGSITINQICTEQEMPTLVTRLGIAYLRGLWKPVPGTEES
jgi:hypothetical protein